MFKLIGSLLVVLTFGWAGSASANLIRYEYQGNTLPEDSDFPNVTSVSGWFDVGTAIAPNTFFNINVLRYLITDGVSTIASDGVVNYYQVGGMTDDMGNIESWNFFSYHGEVGETLSLGEIFIIGTQGGNLFHPSIDQTYYCVELNDAGGCYRIHGIYNLGSPGTWSVSEISEVPLPATLPLLGIGLAALGFSRRKRKLHI